MHELAVRNHDDDLTPAEKEEMHAFGRAATVMSILKSRARRRLGINFKTHSVFRDLIYRHGESPGLFGNGRTAGVNTVRFHRQPMTLPSNSTKRYFPPK